MLDHNGPHCTLHHVITTKQSASLSLMQYPVQASWLWTVSCASWLGCVLFIHEVDPCTEQPQAGHTARALLLRLGRPKQSSYQQLSLQYATSGLSLCLESSTIVWVINMYMCSLACLGQVISLHGVRFTIGYNCMITCEGP